VPRTPDTGELPADGILPQSPGRTSRSCGAQRRSWPSARALRCWTQHCARSAIGHMPPCAARCTTWRCSSTRPEGSQGTSQSMTLPTPCTRWLATRSTCDSPLTADGHPSSTRRGYRDAASHRDQPALNPDSRPRGRESVRQNTVTAAKRPADIVPVEVRPFRSSANGRYWLEGCETWLARATFRGQPRTLAYAVTWNSVSNGHRNPHRERSDRDVVIDQQ